MIPLGFWLLAISKRLSRALDEGRVGEQGAGRGTGGGIPSQLVVEKMWKGTKK